MNGDRRRKRGAASWLPKCGKWRATFVSCGQRFEAGLYETEATARHASRKYREKFGGLFEDAVVWLRTAINFQLRIVKCVRCSGEEVDGTCFYRGKSRPSVIEIARDADDPCSLLIHEVSHAIDFHKNGYPANLNHATAHRRSWAIIYGRVYREFWRWYDSQNQNPESL